MEAIHTCSQLKEWENKKLNLNQIKYIDNIILYTFNLNIIYTNIILFKEELNIIYTNISLFKEELNIIYKKYNLI